MRHQLVRSMVAGLLVAAVSACAPVYKSSVSFPSPGEIFVTTGDGNIQKPYTPVGQLIYGHGGFRIPLPIFGLIPIVDVDPAIELRQGILQEVRRMGGDGVINLSMDWQPPSGGWLGLGASGGHIVIYGTVIKR